MQAAPTGAELIHEPGVSGSVDLNEDVDTAGLRTRAPSLPDDSTIPATHEGVPFHDYEPSSLEDIAKSELWEQVMKDE